MAKNQDENTVLLEVENIVSYKKGDFKAEDGRNISYENVVVIFGGREIKLKSKIDLTKYVEEGNTNLVVQVTPGTNQVPSLVVVGIGE